MISKFTETNVKKPARGGMNIKSSIANELWYVIKSFFFSSRRRHTRWNCDWSSDVCSSDLLGAAGREGPELVAAAGQDEEADPRPGPDRGRARGRRRRRRAVRAHQPLPHQRGAARARERQRDRKSVV